MIYEPDVSIQEATAQEMDLVRTLFREYETAIGVDLCFQGFEQELASLPGAYKRPNGFIFIAFSGKELCGCIALKPLDTRVCEMKRLYVRPNVQGLGLGKRLATSCIEEARIMGYSTMRLDTLEQMKPAIGLYRSLGFRSCEPYYDNPLKGVVYMERGLD